MVGSVSASDQWANQRREECKLAGQCYLNFNKFRSNYFMSLLRKNTMPEGEQRPEIKKSQFRTKACSQINIFQLGNHSFGGSNCYKNARDRTHGAKLNSGFRPQEKLLTKEEVDKIVSKNSLTVNFNERCDVNALPSITSFDKIKGILIKKSIFERFKECHKENGSYHEELEELSREEELSRSKLNINTQFKLPSNTNQYKNQRKSLSVNTDARSGVVLCQKRLQRISDMSNQSFRKNRRSLLKHSPKKCTLDNDNEGLQEVKNRLKVMQKLQNIAQACSSAVEDFAVQKSINLFARFSEKMDERLLRKKKKLDKVNHFRL